MPASLLLKALPSEAEAVAEDVERAEVVNSKDKERLPQTPPPRRRKTRVNQGRKSEDIRKRVLTAVGKI